MKDENESLAERLEQGLQDLKNSKKAASVSAAKFAQELEKFDEVQKKLDALPYHERREVLDASGLKHRSAAPRPITTPRDLSRDTPSSRPPEVLAMAAPTEQLAPAQNTATPAPLVTASDAPAQLRNQRPDLLTPLIQKAQRDEPDPFSAAVIWPKLCDMAELKTNPFIGKTESGLKWKDANDSFKYLTKNALADRLRRAKRAR